MSTKLLTITKSSDVLIIKTSVYTIIQQPLYDPQLSQGLHLKVPFFF